MSQEVFVIRNEFAMVEVARDDSAKGLRLHIRDVQSGDSVYLDSLELEALTRIRHEEFAPFVDPNHPLDDSETDGDGFDID